MRWVVGVIWILSESFLATLGRGEKTSWRTEMTITENREMQDKPGERSQKLDSVRSWPPHAGRLVKKAAPLPGFRPNFFQMVTRFRTGERV